MTHRAGNSVIFFPARNARFTVFLVLGDDLRPIPAIQFPETQRYLERVPGPELQTSEEVCQILPVVAKLLCFLAVGYYP